MNRLLARAAALATAALVLAGCGPDLNEVKFQIRTAPPGNAALTVSSEGIRMPVGVAVAVLVTPYDESGEIMEEDEDDETARLELSSSDARVFGADRISLDERSFVLYGVAPGTTELEARFEDDSLFIPVTIDAR